jgi:hypothetical protein
VLPPAQPYAGPTTILVNELDAGSISSVRRVASSLALMNRDNADACALWVPAGFM